MCHHKPVEEWERETDETEAAENEREGREEREEPAGGVVRAPIEAARRLVTAVTS